MNHPMTAEDDVVQVRHEGAHIAVVTLNRPHRRNAINGELAKALDRVVKTLEADTAVRAVILTAAGRQAFCAGADLKEMAAGADAASRSTPDGGFAGFVFAPRRKLWIAAVNGPAVAGGFELVLACDMAIASTDASFSLPEVSRGLVASAGGVFRLPRVLPRGVAIEIIAAGGSLDARRAAELGLVNRVVAPDELMPEALRIAARVAANAPLAVLGSLEVARRAHDTDEAELRRHAHEVAERIFQSEDAREGPRAFAEHRAPVWLGR